MTCDAADDCIQCKSCVRTDGRAWCYKACIGNGSVPKTEGPRELTVSEDGTIPIPETCAYRNHGAWGSLLYEHPHPTGMTCDGCTESAGGTEPSLHTCSCRRGIVFPLKGDDRECPFRTASYRDEGIMPAPCTEGPSCSMAMAEIIVRGINEHDLTFWGSSEQTYNRFADFGCGPATYRACKGFDILYDWKKGITVRIGTRLREAKSNRMITPAEIGGLTSAAIDRDTLYITDSTSKSVWVGRSRITIAIDDAVTEAEDVEIEDTVSCTQSPKVNTLEAWIGNPEGRSA